MLYDYCCGKNAVIHTHAYPSTSSMHARDDSAAFRMSSQLVFRLDLDATLLATKV